MPGSGLSLLPLLQVDECVFESLFRGSQDFRDL
jgi:hypothetical protein